MQKNTRKITETLANGYSSENTRRELSNEYQDDRVSMVFQEFCILVLWTKVVSALEGLTFIGFNLMILFISFSWIRSVFDKGKRVVSIRPKKNCLFPVTVCKKIG